MTNILSKLTLTNETKKEVAVDKTALRRAKVVMNLLEQAEIAKALGVVYKNGTYWWWSDFVWGTGGAGSRYGVGMDGYARDGFYGGYGWVMVIIDSNNY